MDRRVQFLARGGDYAAFLTANEVVFAFRAPRRVRATETRARQGNDSSTRGRTQGKSLCLRWLDTNPSAKGVGLETLPTKSNYFLGNNPARWRTDVPRYARVRYARLYPGVDAVFYGRQQELAYDLIVAPGSDPGKIKFELQGASRLQRNAHGDLVLQIGGHDVVLRRPVVYQETGGTRRYLEGRYVRKGQRTIGFAVAAYDRRQALVIDPSLSVTYASFLGGSGSDVGNSVVLDSSGSAYVGGNTTATDFPELGSHNLGHEGGDDLFIAKIDTTQTGAASLVYLTFLGGSGNDDGGYLAVDSANHVAFLATTTSADFPVTDNSKRHSGPNDLIVGALNPSGDALVFATYFGGNGMEDTQQAAGIAVDSSSNIYITSDTTSTNLPATLGAFRTAYGGGASDGFLAKFDPKGTLTYCSYLGINATVGSAGIAADAAGNVYLAGFTSMPSGTSFPTMNGFQTTYVGGTFDAFVMKLDPVGRGANDLVYSTFLGGSALDKATAIAVDNTSPPNAYVTGTTQSADFPTNGTNAAFQASLQGPSDAFVSVISQKSSGATSLNYSTYLGGMGDDNGHAIAVVTPNQVYVAGKTTSLDFPAQNFLQPFSGTSDAFVAKLDPTMSGTSSLLYATYLGGGADAQANALVADSKGNAFVTGQTTSADFPLAGNPNNGFQPICTSCNLSLPLTDAFLTVLTENLAPSPEVAFSPSGLNFGSLAVGSSAPPQTVTLSNNGNAALSITGISVAGTNSGDFAQTNNCPLAPATLDAGSSCAITLTFAPTIAAAESAAVNVVDNASGNPQSVTLRGTGIEPLAVPSPTSLDFGNQPQGGTSNAQTITVTNAGNVTLQIGPISLGGTNPTDFSFTNTNCGATLAAGANCSLRVNFIPAIIGPVSGDVIIADNSGNTQGSTQVVALSGTGTPPAPLAGLLPTMLDFGAQVVGGASGPQTVMLKNTGSPNYPLHIAGISITGANATEFNLPASGMPCPIGGNGLQPGAICDIVADFVPSSTGAKSAAITVTDDASDSPQMIPLSGTATAPVVSLTPATLAFSDQPVGSTSAPQSVTLGNTGTAALTIASISIAGADAGDFPENNNCPPNLNASSSCIIQVAFAPAQAGSRTATLMIADNAAGNPHSVGLQGSGVAPVVLLTPSNVAFGPQLVGSGASPVAVTVTNNGSGPLSISKISFSGANSGDFSTGPPPPCGTPVSVGGTCTINVTFQPAAPGSRSAALNVNDNALGSPQTATLTGTGTDFTFAAASGGSTSLTLTAGQSGSYNLQLTPSNGFSGSVALSCSGTLPAGTCSASPATLNVSGTAPATFAVNVMTTASLPPAARRWIICSPRRLLVLAMVLALAALILASAFAKRRWRLSWGASAALFVMFALLSACGGGGGGGGGGSGPMGTPPGTYTLIVTGTQQGSSRTLNLNLVVQ